MRGVDFGWMLLWVLCEFNGWFQAHIKSGQSDTVKKVAIPNDETFLFHVRDFRWRDQFKKRSELCVSEDLYEFMSTDASLFA